MSAQPVSALRRLVERGKANSPPPSTCNAPTVGDANSFIRNVVPMDAMAVIPGDLVDGRDFEGLNGDRVPQLEPLAYDVQSSTSSNAAHLQKPVKGHSVGPNRAIPIESCDGNISGAVARSAVFKMRSKGTEVTQDVANELVAGFSTHQF
jgi:hypothetical protein